MTPIPQLLDEIEARASDSTKIPVKEEKLVEMWKLCVEEIPRLVKALRKAIEQRDSEMAISEPNKSGRIMKHDAALATILKGEV